jgi:hypothetical protein
MRPALRIIPAFAVLTIAGFLCPIARAQVKTATQEATELGEKIDKDRAMYPTAGSEQERAQYTRLLIGEYIELARKSEKSKIELDSKLKAATDPDIQDAVRKKLDDMTRRQDAIPDEIASLAYIATKSGNATKSTSALVGQNLVSTGAALPSTEKTRENNLAKVQNTPWTRAVVGFNVSGASSTESQSDFFADFFVSAPLGSHCGWSQVFSRSPCTLPNTEEDPLESRFWVWANPRIASVQRPGALGGFASATSFIAPAVSVEPNKIVKSFEFVAGIELAVLKPQRAFGFAGGDKTTARLGISLIAGGGAITPLSKTSVTPAIFNVNDAVRSAFNVPVGKDFIAFPQPDRDRFFRQYELGIRLKTFFFKHPCLTTPADPNPDEDTCKRDLTSEVLENRFPGIFDITYGQNEYVTGGRLTGRVMKIEGFYPLPFVPSVHVFGGVEMVFRAPVTRGPFVLTPPSGPPPNLDDASVFLFSEQPNRDRYRIGVGLDLLQLLRDRAADAAAKVEAERKVLEEQKNKAQADKDKLQQQNEELKKEVETLKHPK